MTEKQTNEMSNSELEREVTRLRQENAHLMGALKDLWVMREYSRERATRAERRLALYVDAQMKERASHTDAHL